MVGCAGKNVIEQPVKEELKPVTEVKPSTGWIDMDTYTVIVTASDFDEACSNAKHQILQDIVKVRMLNESRYTDITKISAEFEKPLKEGKVISEKKIDGGIEIYYQIKEAGLKKKFEKK